jgi:hypothetical protein
MSHHKRWRVAMLLLPLAAAAVGASHRGTAQTMYPYIWGISNLGETCAGWCYAGPHGGEYICCGVTTKPAPNP